MSTVYNNIPITKIQDSADGTRYAIENFYGTNMPINASTLDALVGFFTSAGFNKISAETITNVLLYQAQIDGYNPMEVIENIKGLSGIELTALVTEILNFNRYKTSVLGLSVVYNTPSQISREILP
jgi:hypothetical protein